MQEKHLAARALDLDLLRLLCSFLVIVNHTYDYVRLSEASAPVRYASFAAFSFSKIAVPIFLMISGFTLLSKTDDIKKTFSRVLRIGLSLVVFSFVYEVYRYVSGQQDSLSIKRFLLFIYEQHTTTAFWYLYAYLGLLVMLPFLQKLAHAMSKQDFLLISQSCFSSAASGRLWSNIRPCPPTTSSLPCRCPVHSWVICSLAISCTRIPSKSRRLSSAYC